SSLRVFIIICFFTVILYLYLFFFLFNDPATTEIYTLSLHDALPISVTDAEARKRGERTGLDTLVVHAVNDECSVLGASGPLRRRQPNKHYAWGVRPQG